MKQTLRELIQSTTGRFFKVSFIKRTSGERREMVCRIGVSKHLKGGSLSFNPKDHDLQILLMLSLIFSRAKSHGEKHGKTNQSRH
jgi:hypothetical protein